MFDATNIALHAPLALKLPTTLVAIMGSPEQEMQQARNNCMAVSVSFCTNMRHPCWAAWGQRCSIPDSMPAEFRGWHQQ